MAHEVLYLGKCTVVPKVSLVGETIANVTELSFFDILFDRVQWLLFGDLRPMFVSPNVGNFRYLSASMRTID